MGVVAGADATMGVVAGADATMGVVAGADATMGVVAGVVTFGVAVEADSVVSGAADGINFLIHSPIESITLTLLVCGFPSYAGFAPIVSLNLVTALLNISLASLFNFAAKLNDNTTLSNFCDTTVDIVGVSVVGVVSAGSTMFSLDDFDVTGSTAFDGVIPLNQSPIGSGIMDLFGGSVVEVVVDLTLVGSVDLAVVGSVDLAVVVFGFEVVVGAAAFKAAGVASFDGVIPLNQSPIGSDAPDLLVGANQLVFEDVSLLPDTLVFILPPVTGFAPTVLLNLVTALLNISLASLFNFADALNEKTTLSNCCAADCCNLLPSTLSLVT
jgi:hypothetical protein